MKEVLAESIRTAVAWGPEHVVLLVRDIRHVALSTYETNQRIPWDLNYRRRRLIESARAVMEIRRHVSRRKPYGVSLREVRRERRIS